MIQTGVRSTGSRRSARRKRSFCIWCFPEWVRMCAKRPCSVGRIQALAEHQLESALELRIARLFERGQCIVTFEEYLALEADATTLLTPFASQRPAAEQVLLQADLIVARRLA